MNNLARDILQTYWMPGDVIVRKQAKGVRESQLLAWVMIASLISFFVRLPGLIEMHASTGLNEPLSTLVGATMAATMVFGPLFLYIVAAISHLIARLLGGQGDWQSGRLALFWTVLALQPVVILTEIIQNSVLNADTKFAVAILSGLYFLWTWLRGLFGAETSTRERIA